MKKIIYKNYTIKEHKERIGGFFVMVSYDVFRDKTHISKVLNVEEGKKKIDQLTGGFVK
jgi:hypothetical protein